MNEAIFAVAHYADLGVLILLILLAIVAIGLIIFKFFQYYSVQKFFRKIDLFNSKILNHEFCGILEIPQLSSEMNELLQGLVNHQQRYGSTAAFEFFEVRKGKVLFKFESSLAFLATVGSNAPYIGLFGTVLGIMKAFNDMTKQGAEGSGSVMTGISSALIATAAGLLVAIPSVLAFNYFQKRLKKMSKTFDDTRELITAYFLLEKARGGTTES